MSEETDKPTENPLRTSGVELTDKNGDEGEVEVKKVFKKKKYFAGFKPYEERGCTDCLCLVIFLIFLSGWLGLMIFSMIKGKPEVLYRATDYEGNVCGEYLNTNPAKSFEKGTAPSQDITTLKVGVMPRLVDDNMHLTLLYFFSILSLKFLSLELSTTIILISLEIDLIHS